MAVSYKVLSQSQTQEINPAGTGFVEMWNITYRVIDGPAAGTTATVQVTDDNHNPDDVAAAIGAKIASLSGIASLGSK